MQVLTWLVSERCRLADQQQLLVVHRQRRRQPQQCQPEQRQRQQQQRQQQQLRVVCEVRVTPVIPAVLLPSRLQAKVAVFFIGRDKKAFQ